MARAHARMARRRSRPDRITVVVLIAFIVFACITAVLAVVWARNFLGSWTFSGVKNASITQKSGKGAPGSRAQAPSGPLQRGAGPGKYNWDGKSRLTLLVMGLDYRDWENADIPRTDSMILLSIDPETKTAGILSIPRDLWVNIPGMGENKINTAYRLGEMEQVPGGGPALAMQTVQELLGFKVDCYALLDFNAFVKFIDEMGGLDMKIREEITIDPIGPGNTRTLQPGTQTLTGAEALAYARQRYTANGDFDRSQRQQEVIMAIRKQIVQFNMLPTLISKAPQLYQDIASGISSNLTLDQMIQLATLAAQVNEKNIKKGVIAPPAVEMATAYDGQSILNPVPGQIRILRDDVFSASAPASSAVPASPTPLVVVSPTPGKTMKQENARVLVKNGTSTSGLASKASAMLRGLGINVVGEDNADSPYEETKIYDYAGMPETVKFLQQKFNVPNGRVVNSNRGTNTEADIEVILGSDWASQQK